MVHASETDWLDKWKSKHEAAHAVLAIVHGAKVSFIDIDFHGGRIGVYWSLPPHTPLWKGFSIIGAGAAMDRRLASLHEHQIATDPTFLTTASSQDRATVPALVHLLNQTEMSATKVDETFEAGILSADATMNDEWVMQAIVFLSERLYAAFADGRKRMEHDEVYEIVMPILFH